MPRKIKSKAASTKTKTTASTVTKTHEDVTDKSFLEKFQNDLEHNQSYLNLILGSLIVIVLGILLFNYFNKPAGIVGPASDTTQNQSASADVSKDALPGSYTVKEGDTLFSIAQKYYDDGYKYKQIIEANKLANENVISVGQVLTIPKETGNLANNTVSSTPAASVISSPTEEPSIAPSPMTSPSAVAAETVSTDPVSGATGGATNQTIWGEKIDGSTYTVQSGDWLSKIAGRAYGDIYQYQKIAQANNISNPDLIEPGTVLQIPR